MSTPQKKSSCVGLCPQHLFFMFVFRTPCRHSTCFFVAGWCSADRTELKHIWFESSSASFAYDLYCFPNRHPTTLYTTRYSAMTSGVLLVLALLLLVISSSMRLNCVVSSVSSMSPSIARAGQYQM